MFDIGYSELLLIAIVTLLVVGPKELPRLLRNIGQWTGKARSMARHFRSGFDTMVREAELEEMNKRWADQNAQIMGNPDLPPDPEADFDREEVIPEMAAPAPDLPDEAAPNAKKPRAPRKPKPSAAAEA